MAQGIISQSGKVAYGVNYITIDYASELSSVDTSLLAMGSTCHIIENGNIYKLNSSKQWILQPSGLPTDVIYDGGTIS